MNGHWYLVASQKSATIFTESPRGQLNEVKVFDNPLGRERNRALFRKQAGMGFSSQGQGSVRFFRNHRSNPHEEAASQFAREICKFLENGRQKKLYMTLAVFAEPHFMGKLRAHLDPKVKKRVSQWEKKDLQKTSRVELPKFLFSGTDDLKMSLNSKSSHVIELTAHQSSPENFR